MPCLLPAKAMADVSAKPSLVPACGQKKRRAPDEVYGTRTWEVCQTWGAVLCDIMVTTFRKGLKRGPPFRPPPYSSEVSRRFVCHSISLLWQFAA